MKGEMGVTGPQGLDGAPGKGIPGEKVILFTYLSLEPLCAYLCSKTANPTKRFISSNYASLIIQHALDIIRQAHVLI